MRGRSFVALRTTPWQKITRLRRGVNGEGQGPPRPRTHGSTSLLFSTLSFLWPLWLRGEVFEKSCAGREVIRVRRRRERLASDFSHRNGDEELVI